MQSLTIYVDVPINTAAQTVTFPSNKVLDKSTIKQIAVYDYNDVTQDSNGNDIIAVADRKFMHLTLKRDNVEIFSRVPFAALIPTLNYGNKFDVNQKIDVSQCVVTISKPITKDGYIPVIFYYE